VIVKFAHTYVIQREHQQPVQDDQFVMCVHATDKLVALPVRQLLDRVKVDLELDDLKIRAHCITLP
jgi:hypothetical protein